MPMILLFWQNLQVIYKIRLNLLQVYCIKWKLKVNIDKTKIMIFPREDYQTNIHFKYGDKEFEIVKYFLYLGINSAGQGHLVMLKKNW